jgi:hypothetical protein
MNNQEIIDNAPEDAIHVDGGLLYTDKNGICVSQSGYSSNIPSLRSLADIKRIVELEKALDKLIDRAQQVDSWESFPESWLDEAYEALKEPKT